MAKHTIDLSEMRWTVTGYVPYEWQHGYSQVIGAGPKSFTPTVEATVPGSVQQSLLRAGLLPDWTIGLQASACEWVENRHWLYEMTLPAGTLQAGRRYRLVCLGLDGCGDIHVNGRQVCRFDNAFVPHTVDLGEVLKPGDNRIQILFECPPRWLGQFHYTSRIRDWKARFNYTWDWTSRLVQIGVWDAMCLESYAGAEISELAVRTDYDCPSQTGRMTLEGTIRGTGEEPLTVTLSQDGRVICQTTCSATQFCREGIAWEGLPVAPWWPNGQGEQPLYEVTATLADPTGQTVDEQTRPVGFKHIEWRPCEGAPAAADPWLCVVNDRPVFLQGVNWTPIRPNFADVTEADYRRRLEAYRRMGCNVLRVWGGAFLEKKCFYDLCDAMGLLVWQEFPLSSSGIENYPPEEDAVIDGICTIAESYIRRRHHHVSLLVWSGGNELTTRDNATKPIDESHPLVKKLGQVVRAKDPKHRFAATSPTGPTFCADREDFGKGLHWDVHGPWKADGLLDSAFESYWQQDDALFRSELGAPGPSDAALILRCKGDCDELPIDNSNMLWRRTGWWTENAIFEKEFGRPPTSLIEYVQWGQQRQANILKTAVRSCKARFPKCGGVLLWMGHDSFPCAANTSILDFDGNPKPAVAELTALFQK